MDARGPTQRFLRAMTAPHAPDDAPSRARDPRTWVLAALAVAVLVGSWWNLPCTDAWSNDEVSPRASTLGAVFETWTPGHFFRYPPLHVLLLTVLQSPVIVAAGLRAGFSIDALGRALIDPSYMTVSCVIGRVVALAMALATVVQVDALWTRLAGRRAGIAAAALVAANPVFVYFAHAASCDVPSWCWLTRAALELDRVASGERRERHAALSVAAAMLTKDQSAFYLAGTVLVTCVLASGAWRTRRMWSAAALAAGVYLVVAGVVTNPSGFARKVAFMTGEGNQGWTLYAHTLDGALAQLAEITRVARSLGGVVWVPALVGIALAARGDRALAWRRMAPLASALTYLALFVVPSRWTMERHLFPLWLALLSYAGLAIDAALTRWPARRAWVLVVAALMVAPRVREVASVDATLDADARVEATRFLRALPRGTRVEVYAGNQYLPHLPTHLSLARVGPDDPSQRSPLPGVTELRAPFGEVTARDPEYLVVSESQARLYDPSPGGLRTERDDALARDPDGHAFFAERVRDAGAYRRVLRARCEVPWPLSCVRMHFSTGAETWIYRRRGGSGGRGG